MNSGFHRRNILHRGSAKSELTEEVFTKPFKLLEISGKSYVNYNLLSLIKKEALHKLSLVILLIVSLLDQPPPVITIITTAKDK